MVHSRITKLEKHLKNKKYSKIESELNKYPRLDKHFVKYEDFKFRKIVIKNAFNKLVKSELRNEILMILNDAIFEDYISKYVENWLNDNQYSNEPPHYSFFESLINFHVFDYFDNIEMYLIARKLIKDFKIKSTEKKLLIYYSQDLNKITVENYDSIKDLIEGEMLFQVFNKFLPMRRRNECKQEIIDDLVGKIKLGDYFNWKTKIKPNNFHVCYVQLNDLYGTENLISEFERLIELDDFDSIGSEYVFNLYSGKDEEVPDGKKIVLSEEQTKTLTGKIGFYSLFTYFIPLLTEEYIDEHFKNIIYQNIKKFPKIISWKVNQYILTKQFDKFNDSTPWKRFNLSKESAKTLLETNRIDFDIYKKYASKEELDEIVNEKVKEVNKLIETYKENKSRELGHKISNIVLEYDLSLSLLFEIMGGGSKKMFKHMIEDMLFGGWGCGGGFNHSFGSRW